MWTGGGWMRVRSRSGASASITLRRGKTGGQQGGASERGKVDYREVLSPEQFALFVKLRALRQGIAKDEAVPVYMVFTNEQLAQMVRLETRSKADLDKIAGVGEARIQKYGERFLACAKQHRDGTDEARRAADGAGDRAG